MTRHLLRLIWNRKRSNFLIMVEVLCAFLVLEGVVLLAAHYVNNYRQPLGFAIDRVWSIRLGSHAPREDKALTAARMETVRQLFNAVGDLPEVEAVCGGFTSPYSNASWTSDFKIKGRTLDYSVNTGTDGCGSVFGVTITRGRWFNREDDGAAWTPVVLNQRFAEDIFGEADPVGKTIPSDYDARGEEIRLKRGDPPEKPLRVVGVMQDFRQHGEYSTPENYMFRRENLSDPEASPPRLMTVKLRAGVTPAFEEKLAAALQGVAKDWSFGISPLVEDREEKLLAYTGPLTVHAVVAGFLLLMVALGLTGVVWQNVTQRIREIGLRRAKGARAENIHRQILGELVVMTSLALLVGVLLLAQIPLLPLPSEIAIIPPRVAIASILISVAAIYVLTVACGWYPARLATKIQPAEALHYE